MNDTAAIDRDTLAKLLGEARNSWMIEFYAPSAAVAEAVVSGAITEAEIMAYPVVTEANPTGYDYPEALSRELALKAGMGWVLDDENGPAFEADAEGVGVSVQSLRDVMAGWVSINGDGWSFYDEQLEEAGVTLEQVSEALKQNTTVKQAAQLIVDADAAWRAGF